MKIKTLVRCRPNWTENSRDGSAVYMLAKDGWQLLGILRGSCGPHGQSTGIFAECKTTAPLAEAAELLESEFFWEHSLLPVGACL